MRKRVLIVGGGGQLGRALARVFCAGYDLMESFHHPTRSDELRLDLSDPELPAQIERLRPNWILIAGALCHVDRCEREPEGTRQVNVEGPRCVARFVQAHGGTVVYYSTDHVFDGTRSSHGESDPVHPINVYATSKVEGEKVLQALLPNQHLILRTAWLYGPDSLRRNFILHLIDRLQADQPVRVPEDQWGSPTYTEDLAQVTRFLLEHQHRGLFHAVGPDFLDRVSLARQVATHFRLNGKDVLATPTAQLGQAARRPLRVLLDCRKLKRTGAPAFRSLAEGLGALETAQAALSPGRV